MRSPKIPSPAFNFQGCCVLYEKYVGIRISPISRIMATSSTLFICAGVNPSFVISAAFHGLILFSLGVRWNGRLQILQGLLNKKLRIMPPQQWPQRRQSPTNILGKTKVYHSDPLSTIKNCEPLKTTPNDSNK